MEPFDDPRQHDEFLISQYLDGDLDAEAVRELEQRLQTDAELARLLDRARATDALVRAWAVPVPELDWDRFTQETAERRERFVWHRRRRRLQLWVPLAAAAVVIFAVSIFWPSSPSKSGPELLVVQYQRMDKWQETRETGQRLAVVQYDHSQPMEALVQRSGPKVVIGVAGTGIGPAEVESEGMDYSPYF